VAELDSGRLGSGRPSPMLAALQASWIDPGGAGQWPERVESRCSRSNAAADTPEREAPSRLSVEAVGAAPAVPQRHSYSYRPGESLHSADRRISDGVAP
jgi:hypothetical protein